MAGNDEEQNSAVSLIRSKFGNGTAGISGQALRTWMMRVSFIGFDGITAIFLS